MVEQTNSKVLLKSNLIAILLEFLTKPEPSLESISLEFLLSWVETLVSFFSELS